jgi:hypothetical protein
VGIAITVNDRNVPLVPLDEMDFDELDLLEEMTGYGAQAAASAIEALESKAWRAVVLISVRRVDPEASAKDLGGVKLFEVMAELESQRADAADDDRLPPTEPASNDKRSENEPSGSNGSTSGENGRQEIRVVSGGRG